MQIKRIALHPVQSIQSVLQDSLHAAKRAATLSRPLVIHSRRNIVQMPPAIYVVLPVSPILWIAMECVVIVLNAVMVFVA